MLGRVVRKCRAHPLFQAVLYGLVYHGLVELTRSVLTVESYTVIRPAAGFALGVLVAVPLGSWPWFLAAGFSADSLSVINHEGLAEFTRILPVVNTSEAALGALLLRSIRYRREPLAVLKDLGVFLTVVAVISTAFVSSVLLVFQFLAGRPVVGGLMSWTNWQAWWLADILGILVVGPAVFSWLRDARFKSAEADRRSGELGFLLATILGLLIVVFRGDFSRENLLLGVPSILVPFVFWLVLRFDFRVVTSFWLLIALFSGWSTQQGLGPFVKTGASVYDRVLANQEFLGVLTLSVLTLSAVLNERKLHELDLSRVNRHLAAMSSRLLQVQEEERRTLALALHDEIGQNLVAMTINLERLRRIANEDAVRTRLDDTTALAEQTLREVRDLALDLRPSILDDFGLTAALQWYVKRQAARAGFEARVEVDSPAPTTSREIQTTCFRVVQEAVTNIIRHAGARNVVVALRSTRDRFILTIQDDGKGFDVSEALLRTSRSGSLGLLGMKERVGFAGGVLEIDSRPGSGTGTTVTASFPFPATEP